MKNKLLTVLLILTALFAGLTLGLYLGRNPGGGSVIVSVPAQTQATSAVPEPTLSSAAVPVNINTADIAELAGLPGIGDVLARRIVDYRNAHVSFTAVEQLTNVEGIGEGKLEAILEQITIGG